MPFMKPYMVKLLREQFPPGTRVRLDSMMNDPQPIPKGMTGTVQGIDDAGQLLMEWDNGRGLSLVPGEDDFTVVKSSSPGTRESPRPLSHSIKS